MSKIDFVKKNFKKGFYENAQIRVLLHNAVKKQTPKKVCLHKKNKQFYAE